MCGIGGIVSTNNSKIDQNIANDMKVSLEHRGPDHSSINYISDSECFIHSRLSIIDLDSRSNQPYQDDDKRYTIVFNGEIYNYKEIRAELQSKGIKFSTEGDTEVLLKGYIEYKSEILKKLRGQFAFAIHDAKTSSIFLARDRIGIKPLYFARNDDWFIFSSELKTIEQSNLIPFEPDIESYIAYLRHLCVPMNRTGNLNISKVQPGEYIEFFSDNSIKSNQYWDPFDIEVNNDISEEEAIENIDRLLNESVEYRKVSDVEVGLFLSGGLDSSLIGKLMKQNEKAGLKGFNIDFKDHFPGYEGELNEAKFAASNNDIDLIEENISYQEFQELLDNYSFYQDDLVGDEVGIPLYFLGKKTKNSNIKVVQVGEGADELFYGYDHWNRYLNLNKFFKPFFKSTKKYSSFKNHRLNMLSNILFNRTSFAGGALGFNLKELDSLIVDGLPNHSDLIFYADNKWKDYFSNKNSKISKWMTLIDLKIRLPELLLMRMDKLVMQSAVEARVPFLDHKLVEYVLSLPEELLIDLTNTKSLLKKVALKYLPDQIINRKKQGFRAPIGEWIKKDEEKFYESVQQFNSLVNLFNERELNHILNGNDYQKKWYLINLSNWHLARVAN